MKTKPRTLRRLYRSFYLLLAAVILLGGCDFALPAVQDAGVPAASQSGSLTLFTPEPGAAPSEVPAEAPPDEDGVYTSAEDVALYLHVYGRLPGNFITKKQAQKLGWSGGALDAVAPGKCIGGDYFGNYEKLLPDVPGRNWHECDIDTLHARSRGSKRLVFSNDGLIYYTEDHYESYVLLYGEDEYTGR